jgi:hypothetical protein
MSLLQIHIQVKESKVSSRDQMWPVVGTGNSVTNCLWIIDSMPRIKYFFVEGKGRFFKDTVLSASILSVYIGISVFFLKYFLPINSVFSNLALY